MVTAFTERFGRIRALAQGARKHGAKLAGHLEVGTITDLSFVVGKNGARLTGARLIESFPAIGESLPKLAARAAMLALLDDNFFEESERAGEVFGTARAALATLKTSEQELSEIIAVWFGIRLFSLLGLLPHSGAPEALDAATVLEIGGQQIDALSNGPFPQGSLSLEFERLARRVGARARIIPAVIGTGFQV